jgi:arylsulfatase A-like enzyme
VLDKNTLIIFSSDNGPHINSGGGLRGTKRDLYEGGIHVPFIARWNDVISAGSSFEHIGAFWDLFATFAELVDVKDNQQTDGISLVPTLTRKNAQHRYNYLYWEFHEQGGKQALRQGNWKAIRLGVDSLPNGPLELYDLSKDPQEKII